jgi:SAM-dependent methyltransferase
MIEMSNRMREHWNAVYRWREVERLGWYEEKPVPSLDLLSKCGIGKNEPILDVGCGATTFIDCLIEEGYKNIIGLDISEVALSKLKERLGERASSVRFIVGDIAQLRQIDEIGSVALWHDRACLHFLVDEREQQAYLSVLRGVVRKGGYVIIATFSLKGAERCSGLKVKRYDQNMLSEFLGEEFDLLEYFEYLYTMPSGDTRPYVYTLFQRKQ